VSDGTARESAVGGKAHELLWHHFIEQHDEPPKEIVLDSDGTDVPVHGDQPGKFLNAYYDHHCCFPLYGFCGRHLLVSYLRTSNRSDSRPQLGLPGHAGTLYPSVLARHPHCVPG
jgi:hypothetical protein